MLSKDDWNENWAVYQSLFENKKLFANVYIRILIILLM